MLSVLRLLLVLYFRYIPGDVLAPSRWPHEATTASHTAKRQRILQTLQSTSVNDCFSFDPKSVTVRSLQDANAALLLTSSAPSSAALSLSTPFDADNASFGAMFTIRAFKDLTVTSLTFYTTFVTSLETRVYVYTMKGNFEGKEESPAAWTIICNTTIFVAAEGEKTIIPANESIITQVPLTLGSNQSFYVTLEQPTMHYTDGLENETIGDVLVSNADMELLIGSAVTKFPFKQVKPLRKFNGGILYKLGVPTAAPTFSPTKTRSPTASPTPTPLALNTPFDADNASFGAMFTIRAFKDLIVTSLAFYTTFVSSLETRVFVYTTSGTYLGKEESPEAWSIICNTTITVAPEGEKTLIPTGVNTFSHVPIELGSNQSFYITLEQPTMHYTNGLENETIGDVLVSNADMELLIGSAVTEFPFKQAKPLRKFNGGILYKLGAPSAAPSQAPTTRSPTAFPTRTVEWGVRPKSLVTGFDGQMLGYGAVFTITSIQTDIKVQSLEFNSAASGAVDVQVYRRAGNFDKEKMATKELWTLVSDTSVTSAGPGKGAVIPEANFEPFRVASGHNHTIYLTLTSKDLLYTDSSNTNSVGSIYTSDNFLKFYVGQGVSQPFLSTVYDERVFNGAIHYVSEVSTNTAVPTPMPISPWIDAFQIDRVLTTDLKGGTGGYGFMFEIRAKIDLVLRSLDFVVNNESSVNVEIWTKPNSYLGFETDERNWRKVSEVAVQGRGNGNVTQVPSENFEGIAVSAGSLQSLYVTLLRPELVYTNQDTVSRGDVFQTDENIEVCAGSGVGGYKFINDTYFPRLFNGAIHYSILSTPAPTPAPLPSQVDQKTNNGVVVTQNLIQIAGVPDGQLSADALGYFQGATGNFLSEAIKSSGVKITNVIVSPNMNLESVHDVRWLYIRIREPSDSTGNETSDFYTQKPAVNGSDIQNDANSTYNSSEGLAKPQRNLGLYTSIAGEYRPPPFLDFTTLVQNSFDDKGEVSTTKLIEDLKQDASFKNASAVTAKTVKFPLPPEILSLMEPKGLSQTTLYIIYSTCGFVVLVAATVLFAMWFRNRRKWRSIQSKDEDIDCDDVGDKGYEYARKEPEILNSNASFFYSQSYRGICHSVLYKPKPELPSY